MTDFFPQSLEEKNDPEPNFGDILQQGRMYSGGLERTVKFANSLEPDSPLIKRGSSDRSSFGLFLESALSAGTKELIGSPPSRDVERFRTENPIGALGSILAGVAPFFIAPQLGVVRAASMGLPGFARAISMADKMEKTGALFRAGAVREATIFAPLESARVVGSVLNPEEGSVGRTIHSAGTELAVLGGLGGTIGVLGPKLRHFRSSRLKSDLTAAEETTEFRVAKHIGPEFNRTASDQTKWAFLGEWEKKIQKTGAPEENAILEDLEQLRAIYNGRISSGRPPVNKGKDTTEHVAFLGNRDRTRRVESLFQPGKVGGRGATGIQAKVLRKNSHNVDAGYLGEMDGFATDAELKAATNSWEALTRSLRIGKIWQGFTQYPRKLVPTTPKAKIRLGEILRKDFTKVAENNWIAREHSEGLTIGVIRRPPATKGSVIERAAERVDPMSGDIFIFKTNTPSKWLKGASEVSDTNADIFLRTFQHS